MMRVRLDEETWRAVLAWDEALCQDEGVEATTHSPEVRVTESSRGKTKTCPSCGRTGSIGGVFYPSSPTYCKSCTSRKINDHVYRVNEATRDHAENHRQPWSELEVETLLAGVAEGMNGKDLAELLGRTYLAVHGKLEAVRKLLAEGKAVTVASFIVHTETTTKVTVTRDPNYVASQPDEDRWWEPGYYKKENQ